jgi:hypothetical protein
MRSIILLVGCLVAAPLGLILLERPRAVTMRMESSIQEPRPDSRIWYSARAYPQIPLPGGRRQIVRSVLNITKPMHFGSFVWDDAHVPKGPILVRIDLAQQTLSVFREGHEIGFTVILYGAGTKPTPTGSFNILEKRAKYYSHSYDAAMPYMLRLTKDGVAIHGSDVRQGWATHGCIGVPLGFARSLFAATSKGDLVIILAAQPDASKA